MPSSEASEFYFLIALGYSVLIGSFVDWLWRVWVPKGLKAESSKLRKPEKPLQSPIARLPARQVG